MKKLHDIIQQSIENSNLGDNNSALELALAAEENLGERLHLDNKVSALDRSTNIQMSVLHDMKFDATFECLLFEENVQLNRLCRLKRAAYSDVARVLIRVINDYQMLTNLPLECSFKTYRWNYFCMLRDRRK